ncbi:MAG: hypothetical protein NZ845_05305 [Thermodesulfovibrio sp.]|nr:hypothetical protein [Thermodesulfovibrio sp.]MCX7725130.1 hypothetical protein [Thermodesulfovibrio sp.]MDW7971993.1 amphi-Trp domain-containing protein [Thermodesulfovibrio sp.]
MKREIKRTSDKAGLVELIEKKLAELRNGYIEIDDLKVILPDSFEVELEYEEEHKDDKTKYKVEIEIEWTK